MPTASHPKRPNIIIVLLDTLRADHLSCYSYERPTTPCIDRIAAEGVVYEQAISQSAWTPPSHASLFTGTYPSEHGVTRSRLVLDPHLVPLPEVMQGHGYRTYGVSNNYWLSRETRFDRGFDEFLHGWQLIQNRGRNVALERQGKRDQLGLEPLSGSDDGGFAEACGRWTNLLYDKVTQKLLRSFNAYDDGAWLLNRTVRGWLPEWRRRERPFFAFLHYMDTHIRYKAPGRYHTLHTPSGLSSRRIRRVNQNPWRYVAGAKDMSEEDFTILRGLYDGEVSYTDHRVGQVYEMLRTSGVLDDSVLIITSDHGENLGDHQLMDHQYCLYDTLLRVPLIIRFPSEFPAGLRVQEPVRLVDVFPTLLQLTGIGDEGLWEQSRGQPLFRSDVEGAEARRAISEYLEPQPPLEVLQERYPDSDIGRYDRTLRSVRSGSHKYIWASDGAHELYDVGQDPAEERNIVSERPDLAAELEAVLVQEVGAIENIATSSEAAALDEMTLKKLEQLGYL